MWFDGVRQPNTIYVANTSRGKDSTAMLRAIELMGWPLDMIVSVDIWFDEETPAELPPMVAFKDEYDAKVLAWFGIPVTRLCATKPRSQTVKVERERERESRSVDGQRTETHSTTSQSAGSTQEPLKDSPKSQGLGAKDSSTNKLTYKELFYRPVKPRASTHTHTHRRGQIYGFPQIKGNWCNAELKLGGLRDSRIWDASGVLGNSRTKSNDYRVSGEAQTLVYKRTQDISLR